MKHINLFQRLLIPTVVFLFGIPTAPADLIQFEASDFGLNTTFNEVTIFDFNIDLNETIVAGSTYNNPAVNTIDYQVRGSLPMPTPSGFSAFNLVRNIVGSEFYTQGSSMSFSVDAAANLSDGLQISELSGADPVFVFNGREVGTGRYHPALVELNANGTGSIRNSNNMGGINPATNMEVDVEFGEEYITEFTFDPAAFTLIATIPEPSSFALFASAGIGLMAFARRKTTSR